MRRDLHGHSPYGELIGTRVLGSDANEKSVEVEYEAKPAFTNRIGTVSGGMLSAMLDSLTGLAALAMLPDGVMAAHTSLQVEYIRPAKPGQLVGRGVVADETEREIRSTGELAQAGTVVARATAVLRVIDRRR